MIDVPSLIAVGMAVVGGSAALPSAEPVLGPELSVVVGVDRLAIAAEASAVMHTASSREAGYALGLVAKGRVLEGGRGRFTIGGDVMAIAQHEWWTFDDLGDRTSYGFGIGTTITGHDLRHPRALSRVHIDARIMFAPRVVDEPLILPRSTDVPDHPSRDVGILLVVGGELGAYR
jgi:hypothetical protein